jgi:uncharacterized protein (UPF0333 family)
MYNCFIKNKNGNTSVEFAFIAPLLIGLTILIIEFCYLMYVQSSLDRAAIAAAEIIRRDDKKLITNSQLRSKICDHLNLIYTCNSTNITIQVTPSGTTPPSPSVNTYQRSLIKGIADNISIKIKWPLFTPLSYIVLGTNPSGTREMVTNIVSHPEPPLLPCPITGSVIWCL